MHYIVTLLLVAVSALTADPGYARSCWSPVESDNTLAFSTEQPGGPPITGEFTQYDGILCLEPDKLDSARVRLSVDTASVDTGLPELDEALKGPVFFDSTQWPKATFESNSIKKLDEGHRYRVKGTFTLRDVTQSMEVTFRFIPDKNGDTATLEGTTTINRLDYGVGQGRWANTQWADDEVMLKFSVNLTETENIPPQ